VAVDADDGLSDIRHVFDDALHELPVLGGHRVADRVRDVDGRSARVDHGLEHLVEECRIRAARVLAGELDVLAQCPRELDALDRAPEHLVRLHAQLVLHVDFAGRQEHVYARLLAEAHRVPAPFDVRRHAAAQRRDRAIDALRHRAHRLEIARRRRREPRLDDVDAEKLELARDFELFRQVQVHAGGLLSVPERRVEDEDPVVFHVAPLPNSMLKSLRRMQKAPVLLSGRGLERLAVPPEFAYLYAHSRTIRGNGP